MTSNSRIVVVVAAFLFATEVCAQPVPQIRSALAVSGLTRPTWCGAPNGDPDRLFILERTTAKVRIARNGVLNAAPFLDLDALVTNAAGEQGLLGLAFHPSYFANGRFFVYYNDNGGNVVIAEYRVSTTNPDLADPGSALTLLTIPQPFADDNGGMLAFSPANGFLYIGVGDGGGQSDPNNRAQDLNDLHGKILRIDVDHPAPGLNYGIPPSNPFAGAIPGRDEIWSYGLRNPWRFSFDRASGDLILGDVGWLSWEEVDFEPASSPGGRNYGWRCMEGNACTGLGGCTCSSGSLTAPIHVYPHTAFNCAVISGPIYRGCAINGLQGAYFHSDHCSGRIWTFRYVNGVFFEYAERTFEMLPPAGSGLNIASMSSWGEDGLGEVYVCCLNAGTIFKVVPGNGVPSPSLSLGAPPLIGTTVPVNLSSPADAGRAFVAGFSLAIDPPIVLADKRLIHLAADDYLFFTLQPGNPILSNNLGATLNAAGNATVLLHIPNIPAAAGMRVFLAFAVVNTSASQSIGTISCPLSITLQ